MTVGGCSHILNTTNQKKFPALLPTHVCLRSAAGPSGTEHRPQILDYNAPALHQHVHWKFHLHHHPDHFFRRCMTYLPADRCLDCLQKSESHVARYKVADLHCPYSSHWAAVLLSQLHCIPHTVYGRLWHLDSLRLIRTTSESQVQQWTLT